jgi:hypothetical protein
VTKLTTLALASTLLFTFTAGAEESKTVPSIRESVAKMRFDVPSDYRKTLPRRTAATTRQTSTAGRVVAGIAGGVGGMFAGAYVGAALEPNCRCDDPGLRGIMIGAPVGAILGAIGAVKLVSR